MMDLKVRRLSDLWWGVYEAGQVRCIGKFGSEEAALGYLEGLKEVEMGKKGGKGGKGGGKPGGGRGGKGGCR